MSEKFQIVIKKGPNTGMALDLTKTEITLGRAKANDLYINDESLAPVHAHLVKTATGYTLENIGSANGTTINGNRLVSAISLQNGDQIGIGSETILEFNRIWI